VNFQKLREKAKKTLNLIVQKNAIHKLE